MERDIQIDGLGIDSFGDDEDKKQQDTTDQMD